jgi:hypothetical protein
MGACATGGGPFKEGYNVVSGIDKYIPVDVYVPGCPPTPEALMYGILKIHEKVERQSITTVPWYRKDQSEYIPIPRLGADIFDPRQVELIKEHTMKAAATQSAGAKKSGAQTGGGESSGPREISSKAQARIEEARRRHQAKQQA